MSKCKEGKRKKVSQKERVEQLIKVLEKGVTEFQYSPDHFKAILEMKALMPSYSFRNLLVAKAQLPHASFLAGFNHWQKLGRKIKKGETSIRIFAPRFIKVKDEENENEEDYKLAGFIAVPVFDVSQTEGEPLPIDRIKLTLEGDSKEAIEIISLAEKIAERDGCKVIYGDTGVANGFYIPSQHSIVVSDKLLLNHKCKTLVHELVHSKVDRHNRSTSTKEREIVAEGTAFIVCSYFGLDTSDYSFMYVRSWSNDETALMTYGTKICDVAGEIIEEFEKIREQEKTKTN